MNYQGAYRLHHINVSCLLYTFIILAAWFCIYPLVSAISISSEATTTTNGFSLHTVINPSLVTKVKSEKIEIEAETPQSIDEAVTTLTKPTAVISTAVTQTFGIKERKKEKSIDAAVVGTAEASTSTVHTVVTTTKSVKPEIEVKTPQPTVEALTTLTKPTAVISTAATKKSIDAAVVGTAEASTFTVHTAVTTTKSEKPEIEVETPQPTVEALTTLTKSTAVISTAVTQKSSDAAVVRTGEASTLEIIVSTKTEATSTLLQTFRTAIMMQELDMSPSSGLTPSSTVGPVTTSQKQNRSKTNAEEESQPSLVIPKETELKTGTNDSDASATTTHGTTSQNATGEFRHLKDHNENLGSSRASNEATIQQNQDLNVTLGTRTSTLGSNTILETLTLTRLEENSVKSVNKTALESTFNEVNETMKEFTNPAKTVTAEIMTKSTPEIIDVLVQTTNANETEKASSKTTGSVSVAEPRTPISKQSPGHKPETSPMLSTADATFLTSVPVPFQTTTDQPSFNDADLSTKLTDRADPILLSVAGLCTVFIIITSVVGNTMTFFVIAREDKLKKAASYFIVSLCVSDMMYSVLDLPFFATRYFHTTSADVTTEDSLCIFVPFIHYFNMGVSLLSIGLVSVNRFVMVAFCKSYEKIYNKSNTIMMILTCWGGMFIFLLPTLLGVWGKFGFDEKMHYCSIVKDENGRTSKSVLIVIGLSLPLLAIIVSYTGIFMIVHRSESRMRYHRSLIFNALADGAHSGRIRLSEAEKKVTKMVLVVFISFLVCYIPNFVLKLVDKNADHANLQIISYILVYVSSCINPIIYYIINKEYKKAYTELVVCIRDTILCKSQRSTRNSEIPMFEMRKRKTYLSNI